MTCANWVSSEVVDPLPDPCKVFLPGQLVVASLCFATKIRDEFVIVFPRVFFDCGLLKPCPYGITPPSSTILTKARCWHLASFW